MGRKHNLYGSGLKEAADIDMIIDGVEDFRKLYVNLIYVEKLVRATPPPPIGVFTRLFFATCAFLRILAFVKTDNCMHPRHAAMPTCMQWLQSQATLRNRGFQKQPPCMEGNHGLTWFLEWRTLELTSALFFQAEDAKTEYWRAHFDPSTCKDQRGGAHMLYFSQLLKRYPGKYMVGDSISIADIVLFDLLELHIRIYKQHLKAMVMV